MASKEKVDTSFSVVASKVQGSQAQWYHGIMSRDDAEAKLQQAGKVGNFLIRRSPRKPGEDFVISYLLKDGPKHDAGISISSDGLWICGEEKQVPLLDALSSAGIKGIPLIVNEKAGSKNIGTTPGLPVGWEKVLDQQTGRYYYIDHNTLTTHWELPKCMLTRSTETVSGSYTISPQDEPQAGSMTVRTTPGRPVGWRAMMAEMTGKYHKDHDTRPAVWKVPQVASFAEEIDLKDKRPYPAPVKRTPELMGIDLSSDTQFYYSDEDEPVVAKDADIGKSTVASLVEKIEAENKIPYPAPAKHTARILCIDLSSDEDEHVVTQNADIAGSKNVVVTPGLPVGWEKILDSLSGRYYYMDHNTCTIHWDLPQPVPTQTFSPQVERSTKPKISLNTASESDILSGPSEAELRISELAKIGLEKLEAERRKIEEERQRIEEEKEKLKVERLKHIGDVHSNLNESVWPLTDTYSIPLQDEPQEEVKVVGLAEDIDWDRYNLDFEYPSIGFSSDKDEPVVATDADVEELKVVGLEEDIDYHHYNQYLDVEYPIARVGFSNDEDEPVVAKDAEIESSDSSTQETCLYWMICKEYMDSLEVDDHYLNPEYDMCYCVKCHDKRGDDDVYTRGDPPMTYALPIGWCRFSLRVPPKALAQNVFEKWHVGFHGTDPTAVDSILRCGELLIPGDIAIGGKKLSEKEGHFGDDWKPKGFDTKQIFLSPSIKYSGCDAYAKPETFEASSGKAYRARVAFQVCIRPESYNIGPETIGSTEKDVRIDPHFDNGEIEWFTKERGSTILYGLLINMEEAPKSSNPSNWVTFDDSSDF